MSDSDVTSLGRRRLLARLGQLFARIDDAFSRGDFDEARASRKEVGELLEELTVRPTAGRDDPGRASGVQSTTTETLDPTLSNRAS
jgi:hypothetical protein